MFFVTKEANDSKSQFEQDFGSFPPCPIRPSCFDNQQFDVVTTSRLSSRPYFFKQVYKLFERASNEASEVEYEVYRLKKEWLASKEEFWTKIDTVRSIFTELSPHKKIPLIILFIIFFPVLFVGLIAVILFFALHMAKSSANSRIASSLGYFLPVVNNENKSEIVINTSKFNGSGRDASISGVISHEHIHLRQHAQFRRNGPLARSNSAFDDDRDSLYRDKMDPDISDDMYAFMKYVGLLNEMEARLHEVVLSFYREHEELPTSYEGFLDLLSGSENLGVSVRYYLIKIGQSRRYSAPPHFKVRFKIAEKQIDSFLFHMKEHKIAYRYITEVLPVMYSNLLRFYGGHVEADEFILTVPNVDLYKEMYESEH